MKVYRQMKSCISFDSYIKPQLCIPTLVLISVVYLLIPTSNHNKGMLDILEGIVVYLLIPTSNHNRFDLFKYSSQLYIF